jgi:hypothetical protein
MVGCFPQARFARLSSIRFAMPMRLLVVGEGDGADPMIRMAARAAKPIHLARLEPRNASQFRDKNCLAFAAIGDPGKFFATLEAAHVRLANTRGVFPITTISPRMKSPTCWMRPSSTSFNSITTSEGPCQAAFGPWPGGWNWWKKARFLKSIWCLTARMWRARSLMLQWSHSKRRRAGI